MEPGEAGYPVLQQSNLKIGDKGAPGSELDALSGYLFRWVADIQPRAAVFLTVQARLAVPKSPKIPNVPEPNQAWSFLPLVLAPHTRITAREQALQQTQVLAQAILQAATEATVNVSASQPRALSIDVCVRTLSYEKVGSVMLIRSEGAYLGY